MMVHWHMGITSKILEVSVSIWKCLDVFPVNIWCERMNICLWHYFICQSVHTFLFVCVPEWGLYEAEVAILRHRALALSNSCAKLSAFFHFWADTLGERFRGEVGIRGLKIISKPANRYSDSGAMAEIADEAEFVEIWSAAPSLSYKVQIVRG